MRQIVCRGGAPVLRIETDLQHHLFLLTLDGRLSLAPIGNNLQNVLDVGTGTGIWALDFGKIALKSNGDCLRAQ